VSVARRKGNPGMADILFSRIVRSRGRCEYPGCGITGGILTFDTAHLIGRRYSATRCQEDNAIAACRTHHQLIDGWWDEKQKVVEATIGQERYAELRRMAEAGIPLSSTLFWASEVERLKARCEELGLSSKRSAA
jgi:hypothetical protein